MDIEVQEKVKYLLEGTLSLGIGLIVAILVLAVGIRVLRSWYRDRDDPADTSGEILDQMRELHLGGDLSDEEFRSIKGQLQSRTTK